MKNLMPDQSEETSQESKQFHPWKPGTLIQLVDTGDYNTPLFKLPYGNYKSFMKVPDWSVVVYVDSHGHASNLMVQVIYGEAIGWTYWSNARSLDMNKLRA